MGGRQKTYRVELTETESKQLQQLVAARKSFQSEAKRAQIVLTHCTASRLDRRSSGSSHWLNTYALVRKWRKRWCASRSLKEAPRSGRPRTFLPIARTQVTAIACSKPTDFDAPLARWSCSDIAASVSNSGHRGFYRHLNRVAMAKI